RLRFPMAITPRYVPQAPMDDDVTPAMGPVLERSDDAARITPPVLDPKQGAINPISLSIDLVPGFALSRLDSPYHRIRSTESADHRFHISLADDVVPADRDF